MPSHMTRHKRTDSIFSSPWWLLLILSGLLLAAYTYYRGAGPGLFGLHNFISPFLLLAACVFFGLAVLSFIWQIIKSALGLNRFTRYLSPRSVITDLLTEIAKLLIGEWKKRQAMPQHTGYSNTDAGATAWQADANKKAEIIGESGAWLAIAQKLWAQGLAVCSIDELAPLLAELRASYQPWQKIFHEEIAKGIRLKNSQIAALRAQRGFFTTITNWFSVLQRKWEIRKLQQEEERYAQLLADNIHTLDSLLRSPELAGAKAELEVIETLRSLPGGYVVLNNVQLKAERFIKYNGVPLQSAQVDHLVLSPAGVFIIETKRWSRQFVQAGNYHNPFDQVSRAAYLCYDLLRSNFDKAPVRNIILSGGALPEPPQESYTKVLQLSHLNGYISYFKEQALSPERLSQVRGYLREHTVYASYPGVKPQNGHPSEELNKGYLKKISDELRAANPGTAYTAPAPAKSHAELIPTEPPPSKEHNDRKYMPPAMRAELDKGS